MPTFDFQGKQINYRVIGEGKPILILNGIMMSTMSWAAFERELTKQNRLILVDMLDQGQSDKMDGPFDQSLQVEVVKQLLDHLQIRKVNVMGTSYGGAVALQFVIKYQEYVDRLVLMNTVARTNAWLKEIGNAWNMAASSPEAYYNTTIPVIYSPAFYDRKAKWMANRKDILTKGVFANKAFMDSMVRLTNSAENHDVSAKLDQIKVPTLIVGSENDHITPLEEQKFLNEHISDSNLVILPNTGHASFYERPWLFVSLLLGFVNLDSTTFDL